MRPPSKQSFIPISYILNSSSTHYSTWNVAPAHFFFCKLRKPISSTPFTEKIRDHNRRVTSLSGQQHVDLALQHFNKSVFCLQLKNPAWKQYSKPEKSGTFATDPVISLCWIIIALNIPDLYVLDSQPTWYLEQTTCAKRPAGLTCTDFLENFLLLLTNETIKIMSTYSSGFMKTHILHHSR